MLLEIFESEEINYNGGIRRKCFCYSYKYYTTGEIKDDKTRNSIKQVQAYKANVA